MANKLYQFRAPEKIEAILEEIAKKTAADSKADVIREALRYYGWMIDEMSEGKEIIAKTKGTNESVALVPPKLCCK